MSTRKMDSWASSNRRKNGNETDLRELYPTPPEATRALLRVESFRDDVWEPACGRGHISRALQAAGLRVVSTDLYAREHRYGATQDFLRALAPRAPNLVTNPPFSLLRPFMERALTLDLDKVILLAPLQALRVQANIEIWREHGFPRCWLLIPALRVDLGSRGVRTSMFNHVWMVWDRQRRSESILLRHLDWREP